MYRRIEELKSIFFPEVYGVWEENGNTFLIEEYIPGETLVEKVEQGCLFSEEELSRYMLQLCEALLVLHRAEPPIIHRDLKPDNILVTEEGSLKLLDFDAAREYDEAQSRDTVILGTKEYASPEQLVLRRQMFVVIFILLELFLQNYLRIRIRRYLSQKSVRRLLIKQQCLTPINDTQVLIFYIKNYVDLRAGQSIEEFF